MKTNKLLILGLAIATLVFSNCTSSDESSSSNEVLSLGNVIKSNFSGKVVDINKQPISNATIVMSGKTVTTNAAGQFTINDVSVREHFAYLTVSKSGFLNGSRTLFPHEGINNATIMLLPETVVATIQANQSSEVTLPNSTKVTFDGAFALSSGTAYTGSVKVIMNHLDPADANVFDKMPGNLIGTRTNGVISGMETYGMINVELKGANNEKLQLAAGHPATISLPIAANQMDTAEAKIPLWHFNETSGLWEEQGFAIRENNKYVGTVSHFSWWNADWAYEIATLNVLVKNFDDTPVNGVRVTISRASGSTGDVLMDLGFTNSSGMLSSGVPRFEILTFRAYTPDGQLISTQVLPSSPDFVRNVVVIIPVNNRAAGNTKK